MKEQLTLCWHSLVADYPTVRASIFFHPPQTAPPIQEGVQQEGMSGAVPELTRSPSQESSQQDCLNIV